MHTYCWIGEAISRQKWQTVHFEIIGDRE